MSSLATAFLAEDDALKELTSFWERVKTEKATQMKIIAYLREANQTRDKLSPPILVITGLPALLKSQLTEETDPINQLRKSLKNVSRDTTVLIQVEDLSWNPAKRHTVTVQGHEIHVSEILTEDTYSLKEHIKVGTVKGKRRDNYVKVKL